MAVDLVFFVIIFLFFLLLSGLFNSLRHKNSLPGPPSLPILGHLHLLKKPLHRSLYALSDSYGPILFLHFGSRPVLVVSSQSLVEECFTKNDIIFANRPRLLAGKYIGYNYSTIGWASYGPHWRNLRRIATVEILSTHRINMYSSVRSEEIQSLVKELLRDAERFGKVELKSKLSELTFNIMMQMVAGKRYFGEQVTDVEQAKKFREIIHESLLLLEASNLPDCLPVLRWAGFRGVEKRMERLVKKRDVVLQGLIEEHRIRNEGGDGGERKKTLMDVLLSLQEKEPEYYTDDIIKGIITVLVSAGTDTSAVTIEWAMSLLLNHPHALDKVEAELDSQVGRHRLVHESDLPNLPYLHCIINETMRLYPAAPLLLPHEAAQGCSVGGYDVPSGMMLLINMWAIHRDPKLWAEPTSFRPERFEGVEGEKEGLKVMPFGYGRRACPGNGMAMRVVGLALGTLIQCFEWRRVGKEEVDMKEGPGLTMPKATPLEARLRPCPNMIDVLSRL